MKGRVHIVDDDASFAKAMERRLKHAGYEVTTYASAQHLLDHLPGENALGCILLDVRIPGLSGLELQERLREFGLTLPIIFLTGLGRKSVIASSPRRRRPRAPSPRNTVRRQRRGH